jgi:hypothetical protein
MLHEGTQYPDVFRPLLPGHGTLQHGMVTIMKYTRREILVKSIEGAMALGFCGMIGDRPFAQSIAAAASSATGNALEKVVTNTTKSPSAKLHSIGVDRFDINGAFWKPKIEVNHKVSIPHQYDECERTGRIDNFRMASGEKDCGHAGYVFNDSDVYKLAEATAYDLALRPDEKLQKQLDEFIRLVAKSQQSDGYLNTAFMGADAVKRWTNLRDWHELYCGGHMVQAAVAHHRTTGDSKFLNVAVKWADCVRKKFGRGAHKGACGHPEVEMALVELYRETGNKDYLDQASLFIERRGHVASTLGFFAELQDHAPIRRQTKMTGHAVRQLYLLSGVADVFSETSDDTLMAEMEKQWHNFTERKMYVTGGAGSNYAGESFGEDYDLPNRTAYCETCAAIASFMWNWRMLILTSDARFADTMETVLYNSLLSGISLNGRDYYYTNPLEHDGGKDLASGHLGSNRRTSKHWDGCACCPPNAARTLAALPAYFHGVAGDSLYIHHYAGGVAVATVSGTIVRVTQITDYPWDGKIRLEIVPDKPTAFKLFARIPGWVTNASIAINGQPFAGSAAPNTYVEIMRTWKPGDVVVITFPMSVRRVTANLNVKDDVGKVALARGPVIYCIEGVDFPDVDIFKIKLPESSALECSYEKKLLGGVGVLHGEAICNFDKCGFKAIPYYSWANRAPGAMRVWIPVV